MSHHDLLSITSDSWKRDGLCGTHPEPDMWFPDSYKFEAARVREAQRICGTCPVRKECLASSVENAEEYGIWGGLTEGQRYKLIRVNQAKQPCAVESCDRPRARRSDDKGWRSMCRFHGSSARGDEVAS